MIGTGWTGSLRARSAGIPLALAALLFASADSAQAMCSSSERRVFFVEFDDGSAKPDETLPERLSALLLPSTAGGRYVSSYTVLASGDIGEGANWDNASESAR
ncbi:MAG TPA: hypothetical protein VF582_08705, partial [Allosphingosinicella sp.]